MPQRDQGYATQIPGCRMIHQTIKIIDDSSIQIVSTRLMYLWAKGGKLEVVIRDAVEDYTAAMRSTYFMWCGEIANATGDDKDEIHQRMKKKHLVPIFRRDDPGYEAMIAAVIAAGSAELGRGVVRLTSITKASRAQMREYMDKVQLEAHRDMGIMLTMPDENNHK